MDIIHQREVTSSIFWTLIVGTEVIACHVANLLSDVKFIKFNVSAKLCYARCPEIHLRANVSCVIHNHNRNVPRLASRSACLFTMAEHYSGPPV